MTSKTSFAWAAVLFAGVWGAGCASTVNPVEEHFPTPRAAEQSFSDSSVEIIYVLGRTHRKLVLESKEQEAHGKNFLDRSVLKEAKVDSERYKQYFVKSQEILEQISRRPASDQNSCQLPYTLTIREGRETRSVSGCRRSDSGSMSRLIREGEFLLLSR